MPWLAGLARSKSAPAQLDTLRRCTARADMVPELLNHWCVRLVSEPEWIADTIKVDCLVGLRLDTRTVVFDMAETVELELGPR